MMCAGFYLFLSSVTVRSTFRFRHSLFTVPAFGGQFGVTGAMILVPFVFGIGIIFYNRNSLVGWLLVVGSFAAFLIGVIASVNFTIRGLNAFEMITMLVLGFGGLGLLFAITARRVLNGGIAKERARGMVPHGDGPVFAVIPACLAGLVSSGNQ